MTKIHVMKRKDRYIVFNSESLSLFSVTVKTGDLIESYEYRSENILEDIGGIEVDIARLLDSVSEKVNCDMHKRWAEKDPKALCLVISHDCNLQCGYCYADHGTFGGERKLMNFETAKKCIDKLLGKNGNNFILFFGGEPFLNFPLMDDIVDYGRQKSLNIKYSTITNGTIMNNIIKKFIYENFIPLQLSLDGPKDINDLQRYGCVESVHDRVLETIDQLKFGVYPLSIKCIITKNSINKLDTIVKYFTSLGVGSIAFAEASYLPKDSELSLSDIEYEDCITELSHILVENLDQLASGEKIPIIDPIFDIIRLLSTKTAKINYCSAGREYVAVTADGDVYPCHGFIGMDEFKMGNVHERDFPGKSYNSMKNIFNDLNVYSSRECNSCWAKFLCGGDCAVSSYVYNNNLSKPTNRRCMMTKSILEALLPKIAEVFQDKTKMQNIIRKFSKNSNFAQNPLPK